MVNLGMVDPIALPTLHDFPASHLRQVTTRRVPTHRASNSRALSSINPRSMDIMGLYVGYPLVNVKRKLWKITIVDT
jgi:hypothetical protein